MDSDLESLTRKVCRCQRHDVRAAQWVAMASDAGFGMTLPDWVEHCVEPDRSVAVEVIAFWRLVREREQGRWLQY